MKNLSQSTATLVLALLLVAPVQAKAVYSGYVCSERVHKLVDDITWYRNLKKAEEAATADNKLILWMHIVGKVEGAT